MLNLDARRAMDAQPHEPESPHFYAQLGEVIAHSGHAHFADHLLQLVNRSVPAQWVDLSEWTLGELPGHVLDIKRLGSAGHPHARPPCLTSGQDQPLLRDMLDMQDPLLIQINPRINNLHQCHLVSRQGNRRWVISLYRSDTERGFALAQLSFLKRLSDTLLPLLEHHVQLLHQVPRNPDHALPEQSQLHRAFYQRLSLDAVSLSAREQQVCLGLLTGGTVPQLAQKLSVKNSSIETYFKRAATKLGVSGRHGLAKWMIGAAASGYEAG